MERIERSTSPLPRECSTTELHGRVRAVPFRRAFGFCRAFGSCCLKRIAFGAGEGNRTLVVSLEGFCSTIELHPPGRSSPKLSPKSSCGCRTFPDAPQFPSVSLIFPMVEGEGFEPSKAEPADLQSAPFGRSGTPPTKLHSLAISIPQSQTKRPWRGRKKRP